MKAPTILCIGGSSGAIDALTRIFAGLPDRLPFPIVAALHRHQSSREVLLRLLGSPNMPAIIEPFDKQALSDGAIYLGPPDYHILVDREHVCLTMDPPVHHARPSIDELFFSAAESFGPGAMVMVLSGANSDGAAGAKAVDQKGGRVLVQDPKSAVHPKMPNATFSKVARSQKFNVDDVSTLFSSNSVRVAQC